MKGKAGMRQRDCLLADKIIERVSAVTGVGPKDIKGKGKRQAVVRPRTMAVLLMRGYFEFTWGEIGTVMNRDRVLPKEMYWRGNALYDHDKEYRRTFDTIVNTLGEELRTWATNV